VALNDSEDLGPQGQNQLMREQLLEKEKAIEFGSRAQGFRIGEQWTRILKRSLDDSSRFGRSGGVHGEGSLSIIQLE
jgi:hypothetical protein